ncbi:MAG: alpha/beta fold hydrolase [Humidesulfovibrio sp.]|nr:alpha/beta fold hydrolase [Humidesulfovibrio sp.]
MTGLVLLHGWGYGSHVWQAWTKAFTDQFTDRPVVLLDAGYFGPERLDLPASVLETADGWIGVGHSLGFARLLGMAVPWRGLIGFGAFLRFCVKPGRETGTPPEILDAMLARLDVAPAEVLRRFTKRCGQPAPDFISPGIASPDDTGLSRLRRDLRLLQDLDAPTPKTVPPVLLLHAKDDRIAPQALAEETRDALPGARLETFATGGHALPFTRSEDCLPPALEFINGLR